MEMYGQTITIVAIYGLNDGGKLPFSTNSIIYYRGRIHMRP